MNIRKKIDFIMKKYQSMSNKHALNIREGNLLFIIRLNRKKITTTFNDCVLRSQNESFSYVEFKSTLNDIYLN